MRKRHWILSDAAFLLVFVSLCLFHLFTIQKGNDWGGDFSVYLNEARNVAEHRPFNETTFVVNNESIHHPAAYPPLTALTLAPMYAYEGLDYAAFKTLLTIFLLASFPLFYVLARRKGAGSIASAVVIAVFGLAPLVMAIKQNIGSDFTYLLLSGLALVTIEEIYRRGADRTNPLAAAIATAVVLVLACLARTTGYALIGGFLAAELWRARRVRWYNVATMLLTGVALLAYLKSGYHDQQQYGPQFSVDPKTWIANFTFYLRMPAALWKGDPAIIRYSLAAITSVLAAAGWIRRLRRFTILEGYLILWCAVLTAYLSPNPRYAMPILPILMIYAAEELVRLAGKFEGRAPLVLRACAVIVLAASLMNLRILDRTPIKEGVTQESFLELCNFFEYRTPANSLILSSNPRIFAFYTRRPSELYPQTASTDQFERELPHWAPSFLVYQLNQEPDRETLTGYLHAAAVQSAFQNQDFQVFAIQVH